MKECQLQETSSGLEVKRSNRTPLFILLSLITVCILVLPFIFQTRETVLTDENVVSISRKLRTDNGYLVIDTSKIPQAFDPHDIQNDHLSTIQQSQHRNLKGHNNNIIEDINSSGSSFSSKNNQKLTKTKYSSNMKSYNNNLDETEEIDSESVSLSLDSFPTKSPSSGLHKPTWKPTIGIISEFPTSQPNLYPTDVSTFPPTYTPTLTPTDIPTSYPTEIPTNAPTEAPTSSPTLIPTEYPTDTPTFNPTETPSASPTFTPTDTPTYQPTNIPTNILSIQPTSLSTYVPSESSKQPFITPQKRPSKSPSSGLHKPTWKPTRKIMIPDDVSGRNHDRHLKSSKSKKEDSDTVEILVNSEEDLLEEANENIEDEEDKDAEDEGRLLV